MTVSVQSIVDRVQTSLQDTTGIRWPVAELVMWVNDAQREVVLYKPDASAQNVVVNLVPGTRQTLPSTGNRLLRIIRNMLTADTSSPGRAIRIVSREVLDAQCPDWHDGTRAQGDNAHGLTVKHYVYDEQDPRTFYVYPGIAAAAATNAFVEMVYSGNPPAVLQGGNLSIPDIFSNAVTDYVLYRAYMKDAEYAANNERASTHFQLFMSSVTGKSQLDQVVGPNSGRDVVGRASIPAGAQA